MNDSNNDNKLDFLWNEYEQQLASRKEYIEQGFDIHPISAFVVKTYSSLKHHKVFINVCSSDDIAKPETQDTNKLEEMRLRIPLSCGPSRDSTDREGVICEVYDCVFHTSTIQSCLENNEYKYFIARLAIENIENKYSVTLDRNAKFPKLKCKGGAPPLQRIRKPCVKPKVLIESVDEKPEQHKEFLEDMLQKIPNRRQDKNIAQTTHKAMTREIEKSHNIHNTHNTKLENVNTLCVCDASNASSGDVISSALNSTLFSHDWTFTLFAVSSTNNKLRRIDDTHEYEEMKPLPQSLVVRIPLPRKHISILQYLNVSVSRDDVELRAIGEAPQALLLRVVFPCVIEARQTSATCSRHNAFLYVHVKCQYTQTKSTAIHSSNKEMNSSLLYELHA